MFCMLRCGCANANKWSLFWFNNFRRSLNTHYSHALGFISCELLALFRPFVRASYSPWRRNREKKAACFQFIKSFSCPSPHEDLWRALFLSRLAERKCCALHCSAGRMSASRETLFCCCNFSSCYL